MRRRDFVFFPAVAAIAARRGRAQNPTKAAKLARVGAMTGNFDTLITEVRDWSKPASPGQLDLMDFADMLADRFGIHNVEVQQIHLLSIEPSYSKKLLGRIRKAHSHVCDMPIELDAKGYSAPLARVRRTPKCARAIEQNKQWIDRAAMLECPSIMPNQGTFPADPAPAIEALKTLRDYGRSKSVDAQRSTHWFRLSSPPVFTRIRTSAISAMKHRQSGACACYIRWRGPSATQKSRGAAWISRWRSKYPEK